MPLARRTDPEAADSAGVRIPAGLAGPIDLELAKPVEQIPGLALCQAARDGSRNGSATFH